MVAHEVAHQWFYSAVGNDQARDPFADEALADYMARDLLNRFVPSQCPQGRLDHSIYDIGDCYAWVVYVQGDAWLRRVSQRAGASRFWSALAGYYAANRDGMGSTYEVLAALSRVAGRTAIDYERFPRTLPERVISLPFGPRLP
jgi:aminopeptidase N